MNTYRCLFGVDVGAVPGGCPEPVLVVPGAAPESPTQHDLEVRNGLIQRQEALLNVYRCRFNIDTEVVSGGCPGGGASQRTPGAGPTAGPALADSIRDVPSDSPHADSIRDVPSDSPHADSIDRLRRNGVLAGGDCGEGRFCPDLPVTGQAFATWLVRILDGRSSPEPVARLVELGVAANCDDQPLGLCPEDPVSRSHMAAFFARAFDLDTPNNPDRFVDVDIDSHNYKNIGRLAATTIDTDCDYPNRFCPSDAVSRAQMANLLARAVDWENARDEVAVTGSDNSINLTVAYDDEDYEATVSWRKPASSKGQGRPLRFAVTDNPGRFRASVLPNRRT